MGAKLMPNAGPAKKLAGSINLIFYTGRMAEIVLFCSVVEYRYISSKMIRVDVGP